MVLKKNDFPRLGEFVIGRVVDIQHMYVYVDLIDYVGLSSEPHARGMIHISEISSRWIKNVRNYVRVGQKIVVRVLRVEMMKGHVDLSMRRVNTAQKKNRIKEWKYATKFEKLLQFLCDETKMTLEEAYNEIHAQEN